MVDNFSGKSKISQVRTSSGMFISKAKVVFLSTPSLLSAPFFFFFFFFVGRRIELARFCLCFCKVIKLISFSVVGSNCCRYRGQDCNLDFSPKRCAVLYNMKNA